MRIFVITITPARAAGFCGKLLMHIEPDTRQPDTLEPETQLDLLNNLGELLDPLKDTNCSISPVWDDLEGEPSSTRLFQTLIHDWNISVVKKNWDAEQIITPLDLIHIAQETQFWTRLKNDGDYELQRDRYWCELNRLYASSSRRNQVYAEFWNKYGEGTQ